MQKKPIALTTATFEKLIGGGLYVDKTRYFYALISGINNCYFCARPRRFGKSLAVSILENIFLGRKELFADLDIATADYDWQEYPVIRLDMSNCDTTSGEAFAESINDSLGSVAEKYGVKLKSSIPAINFKNLIFLLKEKTGRNVVILIDEYDHPLTENIDKPERLEPVREVLENFYKIIKSQEPNERFVFMTGITRFSKLSIFSKLNNLMDISMDYEYACMFGYTQAELEKDFAPYIDDYISREGADRSAFLAEVKRWYDGFKFHWDAETVYNPLSVGMFFAKRCSFSNYWFATATPTFIAKLARKQRLLPEDVSGAKISDASLNTFDISEFASGDVAKAALIQLLFQTGYLTIDRKVPASFDQLFSVRFPDYEVEVSFSRILFEAYSGMKSSTALTYVFDIMDAANNGDVERIMELFKGFFAGIPYTVQIPQEKYYQTVIFCVFKMCGMDVETEVATNKGRIDAVLDTPEIVYVIEFKLDKAADEALEQIVNKEYFQKFIREAESPARTTGKGKRIICLGINFSSAERNITDWRKLYVEKK